MQSNWPDHDNRPPPRRNGREQSYSVDNDYTPLKRSEHPPPYGTGSNYFPPRRHERDHRDYDRPVEPGRLQDDYRGSDRSDTRGSRTPHGPDDFRIKGSAERERSWSPRRRGYIDYDAPETYHRQNEIEPRRRDPRYYNRRPEDRSDRGAPSGRFARSESYDPTVCEIPQQPVEDRNRGDTDVGTVANPVRYLLVRNLKPGISESVFAKGMTKLERTDENATGAAQGSLRSVMLIYDHQASDKKSQGFGFAWYKDVQSAQAALSRAVELDATFTISSQVADVRMAHLGVFPRIDAVKWKPDDRSMFVLPETGTRHVYKDPRYYPVEFIVNAPEPTRSVTQSTDDEQSSTSQNVKKAKKKRAHDGDQASSSQKRLQMHPAMSALANRWSAQHKEIHAEGDEAAPNEPKSSKQSATGVNAVTPAPAPAPAKSQVQTFAHSTAEKQSCWLCVVEWKSPDVRKLELHLSKSQKHADNLKDDAKIQAAYQLMQAKGIAPEDCLTIETPATAAAASPTPDPASSATYLDRAALRREEEARFHPAVEKPKPFSLKNLNKASQPSQSIEQPSPPPPSKGLGMMQRLGYQAGQGLGAAGSTGVTAPIAQDLYAAGVGLGHESGKVGDAIEEAERATKGGAAGYLEKVQERARERFESLNKSG